MSLLKKILFAMVPLFLIFFEETDHQVIEFSDTIGKFLTFKSRWTAKFNSTAHMKEVIFYCINGKQKTFQEIKLNDPDLNKKIDKSLHVNLVVHGWMDQFNSTYLRNEFDEGGWLKATCENWARFEDSTVCAVDWSSLSFAKYKIAALRNTHIAAEKIFQFINILNVAKIRVHAIAGHSLGSHIAGFVGKKLKNANRILPVIYGLDPAGPLFTLPKASEENRLMPDDAKFVQVLHTSAGTFGAAIHVGKSDFWANGGLVQPNCLLRISFSLPFLCDHFRAVEIFRYSLNPDNNFVGKVCKLTSLLQILDFLIPKCTIIKPYEYNENEQTDLFGIHSQHLHGDFQLPTTDHVPYAIKNKLK